MARLYLVKIGGSVITNIKKKDTARINAIDRLLNEVKTSMNKGEIVLGHGLGSFAHIPAHKFHVSKGLAGMKSKMGVVITQDSVKQLHKIVMERAIKAGLDAFSFSPSTGCVARDRKIASWDLYPIKLALGYGFVPLTHGDVIIDSKQGVSIASTEEVFSYLALKLKPYKIVIGTDVDGVFEEDPRLNPNAELIRDVNKNNLHEVLLGVGGSTKIDVTGGMKTKIQHLYDISKKTGAVCQIVNANVPGRIKDALTGRNTIGTVIDAA